MAKLPAGAILPVGAYAARVASLKEITPTESRLRQFERVSCCQAPTYGRFLAITSGMRSSQPMRPRRTSPKC